MKFRETIIFTYRPVIGPFKYTFFSFNLLFPFFKNVCAHITLIFNIFQEVKSSFSIYHFCIKTCFIEKCFILIRDHYPLDDDSLSFELYNGQVKYDVKAWFC